MRITEFQIDRYGPFRLPRTECDGGLEVIYGPNESGKTLLLEALLRLLEPDMPSVMGALDRVADPPAGYLVLESDGETYQLGDGQVLEDIAPVTPTHLRNVFVVRDNDLRIREHHDFYDSVTEQIGDLHTSEIEAIQDRLEDLGRITPTTRNVSSAAEYGHAKDVRDEARQLAGKVERYIETARADGLDDLESELVDVRTKLRKSRSDRDALERAELARDHARLSNQLDTVERLATAHDEVAGFTRDSLERLTGLETDIANREEQIGSLEQQITTLDEENEQLARGITDLEGEIRPLEERETAVAEADEALQSFREGRAETTGAERRMSVTKVGTYLGIGLGGVATLFGLVQGQPQLLLPALLLLIGIGSGVLWYRDHRRVTGVERAETELLETARDAGLAVDEVTDIGPAITEFHTELQAKQEQLENLEHEVDVNDDLMADHAGSIEDHREQLEALRDDRTDLLDAADVADIEEYRASVEEREAIESDLGPAKQSLIDAFGEPEGGDDPIEQWRTELDALVEDIDLEGIDPAGYDEDRHAELDRRVAELEDSASGLRDALDDHRHQLDQFADRASSLDAGSFVEPELRLKARSIEGLRQLAEDLHALVDRIDRDAEISRTALEIFDGLHREEEAKITDLFAPGGRASEVFGAITDDRYQRVEYDPDDRTLKVHRDNGNRHAAADLSQGTRDQLYLAARISLAEELLESEPGFFLIDDAFLPADKGRLNAGFQVLEQLVGEGWQVIYLTAKEEVGVDIVEDFGLQCSELEPLP